MTAPASPTDEAMASIRAIREPIRCSTLSPYEKRQFFLLAVFAAFGVALAVSAAVAAFWAAASLFGGMGG